MPKARAAAISALEIDESLTEARAALAFVQWHCEWKWKDAEQEYRRILKFLPSHSVAHQWYGLLLAEMGRAPEAVEHAAKSTSLDPSPSILSNHAMVLFLAARHREAEEAARETLVHFPDSIRARLVEGTPPSMLRVANGSLACSGQWGGTGGVTATAIGCQREMKESPAVRVMARGTRRRGNAPVALAASLGRGQDPSAFSRTYPDFQVQNELDGLP